MKSNGRRGRRGEEVDEELKQISPRFDKSVIN